MRLRTVITAAAWVGAAATARADNEPPRVAHRPPSSAWIGEPINISCELKDESAVFPPDIYWRRAGAGAYTKSKMQKVSETGFLFTLPKSDSPYEYYIVGFDEYGNEGRAGDEGSPLRVEPQPRPPPKRAARPPPPRPPPERAKRDTKPPSVEAVPVEWAKLGEAVRVEAAVDDESEVTARVFFRASSGQPYRALDLACDSSGYCTGEIPDLYVTDDIDYYVEATDKAGNMGRDGAAEMPKRASVQKPAPVAAVKLPKPKPPPPPPPGLFLGRTWTWVAGGGAVVLLLTGVIAHVALATPFDPAPVGAIVLYGLSAAAAGGAVVLWFVEEPQTPLEPLVQGGPAPGPGWGLTLTVSF